jgi:hypothetical protein
MPGAFGDDGQLNVRMRVLPASRVTQSLLLKVVQPMYGDQHHPNFSGELVVAAFNQQKLLEI